MATKTKPTPEQANDALNALALGQDSAISLEEAFEIMQQADPTKLQSLSRKYFTFPEKGTYIFMVEGIIETTIKDKTVRVVELMNKEKEQLINGDSLLVNACEKLTTLPCFIMVEYKGDEKNSKGTYKRLDVKTFTGNIAK